MSIPLTYTRSGINIDRNVDAKLLLIATRDVKLDLVELGREGIILKDGIRTKIDP